MPPGVVIPELAYADIPAAVEWLCQAFGFTERLRIGNHRVQLGLHQHRHASRVVKVQNCFLRFAAQPLYLRIVSSERVAPRHAPDSRFALD
jgi:uncharacterized glyoxalase superfamily protein PhnB